MNTKTISWNHIPSSVVRRLTQLTFTVSLTALAFTTSGLIDAAEKKVLIIGIDGVLPAGLESAHTPNIDQLIADGCYSNTAQASAYTVSGPGWSSMLTGAWPYKHRSFDNAFENTNYDDYPHFFARAKEARPDLRTASFVDWVPIDEHILNPVGADIRYVVDYAEDGDTKSVAAAADVLANDAEVDLIFFYFADVDEVGHSVGYHLTADVYLKEIEEVDTQLGELLTALESRPTYADEDWLILVSTDHGGTLDGSHGRDEPLHRTIFYLASGPAAARGTLLTTANQVDVPATALAHLGINLEPSWGFDGRSVGLQALAHTPYNENLIFNGDAEYTGGYENVETNVGVAGWTDLGPMTALRYDSVDAYPHADDPGPDNRGDNFFCGGKGLGSSMTQVVDLHDRADDIDEAQIAFELSAYLGGYSDQRDLAELKAEFINASGLVIGGAVVGPVTRADRQAAIGGEGEALTGLLPRTTKGAVPMGTRSVRLTLLAETGAGDCDGYADNLSLVLRKVKY